VSEKEKINKEEYEKLEKHYEEVLQSSEALNKEIKKAIIEMNASDVLFKLHIGLKSAIATTLIIIQVIALIASFVCGITLVGVDDDLANLLSKIFLTVNLTCLALVVILNITEDIIWKKNKSKLREDLELDKLM